MITARTGIALQSNGLILIGFTMMTFLFCTGFVEFNQGGNTSFTIESFEGNSKAPYGQASIKSSAYFSTSSSDFFPDGVDIQIDFPIENGLITGQILMDLALDQMYPTYTFDSGRLALYYTEQDQDGTIFMADIVQGDVVINDIWLSSNLSAIEIGYELVFTDLGPDRIADTADDETRYISQGFAVTTPAPEALRSYDPQPCGYMNGWEPYYDPYYDEPVVVVDEPIVGIGADVSCSGVISDDPDYDYDYDDSGCGGDMYDGGGSGSSDSSCDGDTSGDSSVDSSSGSGCEGDSLAGSSDKTPHVPKTTIAGRIISMIPFIILFGFIHFLRIRRR